MKTFTAKPHEVEHKWCVIDAENKVLGRLATEVARRLRGKHKPIYTPHVDTGDHIIIINADKIAVTGRKEDNKEYHRHTGYPGGLKTEVLKKVRKKNPNKILTNAVKGMMSKNPLGRKMLKKLHVYAGSEHPHAAQQPEVLDI